MHGHFVPGRCRSPETTSRVLGKRGRDGHCDGQKWTRRGRHRPHALAGAAARRADGSASALGALHARAEGRRGGAHRVPSVRALHRGPFDARGGLRVPCMSARHARAHRAGPGASLGARARRRGVATLFHAGVLVSGARSRGASGASASSRTWSGPQRSRSARPILAAVLAWFRTQEETARAWMTPRTGTRCSVISCPPRCSTSRAARGSLRERTQRGRAPRSAHGHVSSARTSTAPSASPAT